MQNNDHVSLSFASLHSKYKWEEIPNCPGRYVLTKEQKHSLSQRTPKEFLEDEHVTVHSFSSTVCKDPICIVRFEDGGGLLSYQHANASYTHTLNTPSGLVRKMNHLEIAFSN
jgi:hypothetical protein